MYTPEVSSPKARSTPSASVQPSNNALSTNGLNASSAQSGANANGPIAILVMTPANRPGKPFQSPFYESSNSMNPYGKPGQHLIGQGVRGVDWVTRISMSLKSGIESEISWALMGLMDLSCRQPEILTLTPGGSVLSTLLDIAHKTSVWSPEAAQEEEGHLELKDEFEARQQALNAVLILRNLALDPKNSQLLANTPRCVSLVERGLKLSKGVSRFSEMKSYCVDIAEAISFHINIESADHPFFKSILFILESDCEDRGILIPALRALSRLVVRDENNVLGSGEFENGELDNVLRYLTVDDDELISAALDLLYQFTLRQDNCSTLLSSLYSREICSTQLVRLLRWKLHEPTMDYIRVPRRTLPSPPILPEWIVNELLEFEEPDRATNWIRASYINDPAGEVTQISLWKAYETQFESYSRQGRKLLPAVEFIKNVTSAFDDCQAMVVNLPDQTRKFIIKGIKPREFPVAPSMLKNTKSDEPPKKKPRGLLVKPTSSSKPSGFGVTAILVLQNLARTPEGKSLLEPKIANMIEASVLNPTISSHLDGLLSQLSSRIKDGQSEGQ